ncbi:hypothetical protein L1887_20816 [Cichorium endivia]|nr:hypothetical protein L1887_20816 [Cichorium endivia]
MEGTRKVSRGKGEMKTDSTVNRGSKAEIVLTNEVGDSMEDNHGTGCVRVGNLESLYTSGRRSLENQFPGDVSEKMAAFTGKFQRGDNNSSGSRFRGGGAG